MEKIINFDKISLELLDPELQGLVKKAQNAAQNAWAPYSKFQVGAAVLLQSGHIILGNNQENAAYPSGLCAERVALFATRSIHAKEKMKAIAIYSPSFEQDKSFPMPCGSCRQVMWEYENQQAQAISILICNKANEIMVLEGVKNLLPFHFNLNG